MILGGHICRTLGLWLHAYTVLLVWAVPHLFTSTQTRSVWRSIWNWKSPKNLLEKIRQGARTNLCLLRETKPCKPVFCLTLWCLIFIVARSWVQYYHTINEGSGNCALKCRTLLSLYGVWGSTKMGLGVLSKWRTGKPLDPDPLDLPLHPSPYTHTWIRPWIVDTQNLVDSITFLTWISIQESELYLQFCISNAVSYICNQ